MGFNKVVVLHPLPSLPEGPDEYLLAPVRYQHLLSRLPIEMGHKQPFTISGVFFNLLSWSERLRRPSVWYDLRHAWCVFSMNRLPWFVYCPPGLTKVVLWRDIPGYFPPVTRLPRWRRRKTRLQVRPLLTMLQGMDRCDFWHANRYWIGLTCDTEMAGHRASG